MKEINIPCDSTIKVQSSLDFYLGITSIGNINSLKELRKSMFDKFMSEYKDMNYPLIDLNSSTALSEDDEDIKEEQTEEVSEGHTSATNFLQMLQHMREAPTPDIDDSDESEEEEQEESEYITPEVDEEEDEEGYLEPEVEEEPLEEDTSSEEAEEVDIDDGREYVSHGIYIEDLIDGTISIPTIDYEDSEIEEEVEDIDWEEEEEESDWDNEDTENIDWDEEDEQEDSLDDIFLPEDEEEEIEESVSQEEDDSESWFSEEESETEESTSYSNDSVQSIKREVSIEDDGPGADVPPDIRVFLKQHPNSDMSYVLKFYPKKEVDKQLKLGRIYKRKGKLMI